MSPLAAEPLRLRLRRFQLVVGLGVVALVLGSLVSARLSLRLSERVGELPLLLRFGLAIAVERAWLLGVLPLLCYGAARVLALRPRATALGAALCGEAFLVALDLARAGAYGLESGLQLVLVRVGTLVLGVWLSERAARAGALLREVREREARERAEATRVEYAEFLARAQGGDPGTGNPSP